MIAVAVAVIIGIVAVTCGIVADSNHPDSLAFLGVMVRTTAAQIFLAGAICTWALFAALWLLSAGIRRSRERGIELRALRAAASGIDLRTEAEAVYADMLGMDMAGADMFKMDGVGADMAGMDMTGMDIAGAKRVGAHLAGFDGYERMVVAAPDERPAVGRADCYLADRDVPRAGTAPNGMPLIRGADAIGAGRLGAGKLGADALGVAIPVRTETEVLGFPNTAPGSVSNLHRGLSTGFGGVRGSARPDGSGPAGGLDGAHPRRVREPGGE